jgi:preprotein translocase subunit YajC
MLNQIFVSDAFAQASEVVAGSPQEMSFTSFVPLILIFVVFYFLIIRPQSKKYKDQQNMIDNLKNGNKVVTAGGIVGVITDIDTKENQIEIEISAGVKIKVLKSYVTDLADKKEEKKEVTKKTK